MAQKITLLKASKKNSQLIHVYLDGEFAFSLTRMVGAWLTIGQELCNEEIQKLTSQDVLERAYLQALRFLNYRARTIKEMKDNLSRKEYPDAVIQETIARLQRAGLLNDHSFAKNWVESRTSSRPRSHRMMAYELHQKGVGGDAIESALETADQDEELAVDAARRQARKLSGLEWKDFRFRLSQFLARRGFAYHTISSAVSQVWQEIQSPDGKLPADLI